MKNKQIKWPKKISKLTAEQKRIKNDFYKFFYEFESLTKKYYFFNRFNRHFSVKNCRPGGRILELGAGLGDQIPYENLKNSQYYALEIRPNMARVLKKRFPHVNVKVGDCQKPFGYPDNFFDRVQAIHVLEHLPNLPATLNEVSRVLKPDGEFCVVMPCEGGIVYSIIRFFTNKQIFEKRYGLNYDVFIKSEHFNTAKEIVNTISTRFKTKKRQFFPFYFSSINLNLCVGMVLKPKKQT